MWKKNIYITYQIFIGIIPTFSEIFIQIDKVWPQLQPKMWSEAILRIYTSLENFIIDSLQKCILEASIDCQEYPMLIERWNCPQMNVQSINGSLQSAFLEAVNDKMVQTCVNSENGLGSRFRL